MTPQGRTYLYRSRLTLQEQSSSDRHHTTDKEPAPLLLLLTLGLPGEIWELKLTLEEEERLPCPGLWVLEKVIQG